MEVRHRRLARLAVRRPGHAPVHAGRRARSSPSCSASTDTTDPAVELVQLAGSRPRSWSAGRWAAAFFGRIGDRLGRSRALSLTILTYALFTGLSFFAQTWWHLLIFRFLAALGIGGEWAVGASLLSETWPQALAAVDGGGAADRRQPRRPARRVTAIFLAGRPHPSATSSWSACCRRSWCFWIRRAVPEPEEWHAAKREARPTSARDRSTCSAATSRRITLLTILRLRAVA